LVNKRYVFTGGGTGGHVYPAVAIADEILEREPEADILYIGNKKGAESHIIPKKGYKIKFVPSVGLTSGVISFRFLKFLIIQFLGFIKSLIILLAFKPIALIGTGGYVSAPVVIANVVLRKLGLTKTKIVIHEQNVVPGRLNKLVAKFSDLVILSSPEAKDVFSKGVLLGYPVRKKVEKIPKDEAKRRLNIDPQKKVVFIFGGSTGARTINRATVEALPVLSEHKNIFIIHGIGRYKSEEYDAVEDTEFRIKKLNLKREKSEFYMNSDFFYDIEVIYSAADLVVSRAGAGTIYEIKSAGIPSIIIPKANLPGDHQVLNAKAMEDSGACKIIFEDVKYDNGKILPYVDGEKLADKVINLVYSDKKLDEMGKAAKKLYNPESLDKIVSSVFDIINGKNIDAELELTNQKEVNNIGDYYKLGAFGLLKKIRSLANKKFDIRSIPEWDYLCYRASGYIASDKWEIMNIGVKLAGLLKDERKIELLVSILRDRRPAPWIKRMFGADFVYVGFIRRNAVNSISQICVYNDIVRDVLIFVLKKDPYFEVRTAAAKAVLNFADEIENDEILEKALVDNLNHPSFEVIQEVITALGRVAFSDEAINELKKFLYSKEWQFRDRAIKSFIDILKRGEYKNTEELIQYLNDLMVVCTSFKPEFPLKKSIAELVSLLN